MSLRFKLDENLPRRIGPALLDLGHDVESALSEHLEGSPDPVLLAACTAEDRILVTLDMDFSDIRMYPPNSHRGIWVLRPASQSFARVQDLGAGRIAARRYREDSGSTVGCRRAACAHPRLRGRAPPRDISGTPMLVRA